MKVKKNVLAALLLIETAILIIVLYNSQRKNSEVVESAEDAYYREMSELMDDYLSQRLSEGYNYVEEELLRETSPDGGYTLVITRIAEPDFPFGDDHLKVKLFEVTAKSIDSYSATFKADVSNDGAPAAYQIEWLEDGVQVALIGSEQPTAYYILPFKKRNE